MKEQDLRRCFSKIKPSESLVSDTIRRINEAGEKQSARASFRFSYRLASAMCALVLVIGLGVAVLYNPTMIPKTHEGETAAQMSLVSGRTAEDETESALPVSCDTALLERMTEDAKRTGGEYAVFFGSLDGCYFGGVTPEEAEDGVMYRCTLTFTVSTATTDETGSIQADVYVYDAGTLDTILASTAGHVYVRLGGVDGDFVVEELIPYSEN